MIYLSKVIFHSQIFSSNTHHTDFKSSFYNYDDHHEMILIKFGSLFAIKAIDLCTLCVYASYGCNNVKERNKKLNDNYNNNKKGFYIKNIG